MNVKKLQPVFGLILALLLLASCGGDDKQGEMPGDGISYSISSGQVKGVLSYQEGETVPGCVCLSPTGEEVKLTSSWSAKEGFELNTSLKSSLENVSSNSYSFLINDVPAGAYYLLGFDILWGDWWYILENGEKVTFEVGQDSGIDLEKITASK